MNAVPPQPSDSSSSTSAASDPPLLAPEEKVLATMNQDGSRLWLRPRVSPGRFLTRRKVLAWFLMAIFVVVPWIHVGGKPIFLLDVVRREFTLFGKTFLPTDTPLLMVLALAGFVGVFLITALFGRVWCGYACPQTVYMEFLFRPLERLFEGTYQQQKKLDEQGGGPRRLLKNITFALIAAFLAHTFLAYFVGWRQLMLWMQGSPLQHPTAFAVMGLTTALMVFDFVWFREQTCLVACPYGRFQSVLFDRDTLIVGYDATRGEPRGKLKKKKLPVVEGESAAKGDCIDCRACVTTCPTGIDIRDGLQMECIGCAQCIDACDAIMDRIKRPRGLIRYGSDRTLGDEAETGFRLLRPRVVIYAVIITALTLVLLFGLSSRGSSRITALRGTGEPYSVLPSGEINNHIRLRIRNRSKQARTYHVAVRGVEGATLAIPENPVTLQAGEIQTLNAFVRAPRATFTQHKIPVTFVVTEGEETIEVSATLLGPGPRKTR